MLEWDKTDVDVGLTVIPFVIGLACLIGPAFFGYGMLEMALGHLAWAFWLAAVAWLASVVIVIRRTRWWWVLASGLPVLVPLVSAFGLLAACYSGDCL